MGWNFDSGTRMQGWCSGAVLYQSWDAGSRVTLKKRKRYVPTTFPGQVVKRLALPTKHLSCVRWPDRSSHLAHNDAVWEHTDTLVHKDI